MIGPRYIAKVGFSLLLFLYLPIFECDFFFVISLLVCVFPLIFIDKRAKERRAPKLVELVIINHYAYIIDGFNIISMAK